MIYRLALMLAAFGLCIAQALAGPTEPSPASLPPVALRPAEGMPKTLLEWPHKPMVLNLWATWCGPCRKEMPALQSLEKKLEGSGISVVALSVDDDVKLMEEFLRKYAIELPTPVAESASDAFQQLDAIALPVTYYVAADGQIVGKYVGAREWDRPEAMQDVLKAFDRVEPTR